MNPEQCDQRAEGVWVCADCGFACDLTAEAVSARLSNASARVRQTLVSISADRLDAMPAPGAWTPREYLAHLTDWSEIIAERINLIVHQDQPVLPGMDQDALATERAYASWPVAETLDRYAAAVDRTRGMLDDLTPADWDRQGLRDDINRLLPLSLFANDLIHELEHHLRDIVGDQPKRRLV